MTKPVFFLFATLFSVATASAWIDTRIDTRIDAQTEELCLLGKDPVTKELSVTFFTNPITSCSGIKTFRLFESVEELRGILQEVEAQGATLKRIHIFAHSNPISIHGIQMNAWRTQMSDLDVMAKDAIIDLRGCNTGTGCMGMAQMLAVGQSLLKRGGTVIGTRFYSNDSIGVITGEAVSMTGAYRALKLDEDGKVIWTSSNLLRSSETDAETECANEARRLEDILEQAKRKLGAHRLKRHLMDGPQDCRPALLAAESDLNSLKRLLEFSQGRPNFLLNQIGQDVRYAGVFVSFTYFWKFYLNDCLSVR